MHIFALNLIYLLEMVETGNGTVTPVVSNLRIDPALVDGYLHFAHFFPSFFIRMLYLLHSLVKYIYMPIYPRVLVYQEYQPTSYINQLFIYEVQSEYVHVDILTM